MLQTRQRTTVLILVLIITLFGVATVPALASGAGAGEIAPQQLETTGDDSSVLEPTSPELRVNDTAGVEQEPGERSLDDGVVATFTAKNTGEGYISFDEEDESAAIEEGLAFPQGEITIEGEVYEDGTWESTGVEFPVLEPAPGLEADATVPNGLSGEFDQNGDFISANGQLTVTILTDSKPSFSFDIASVSTESGDLTGSADFGDQGGTARLVDNEYTIEDTTGDDIVDPVLGLPIEEPGLAWFNLDLEFDISEVAPEVGALTGAVVDQNGDPVEGASVNVQGAATSTETDATGSYEFPELDAGSYDVVVSAENFIEQTATVEITGGETTEQRVELEPEPAKLEPSLEGAVVTAGEPIEVSGLIENTGGVTAEATATLAIDGLSSVEESIEVAPGEGIEITDQVETTAEDVGEYTARLTVGDQTADTEVVVRKQSTDKEIAATFSAENIGFGLISFSSTAGEAVEEGAGFPEGITIDGNIYEDGTWESTAIDIPRLETSADEIQVDVAVPEGISGTIDPRNDVMTAKGEFDVTIVGTDASFQFVLDATTKKSGLLAGQADISDSSATVALVENEYTVDQTTGDEVVDAGLELPADEPGENWFRLDLEMDIDTDTTGGVAGQVSTQNEEPIEGATVTVQETGESVETKEGGAYSIQGLEPATYTLTVETPGGATDIDEVSVSAGETVEQNFELIQRGAIEGVIENQNGESIEGAEVTLRETKETVETDSAGEYAFGGLSAGDYDLIVDANGFAEQTVRVEVIAGETTQQTVTLEPVSAQLALDVEGGTVTAGETIEVTATIENTGDNTAEATTELTTGGLSSVEEFVPIAAGETVEITDEIETSKDDVGEYTATLTVGDQTAEASVVVEDPSGGPEPVGTFTAENTGEGYISFDEETEADAIEEGLAFPEGEITIVGEIYEDGTWESTSVEFPVLEPAPGLEADATVPNGLSGELSQDGDFVSAEGQLTVTILTDAEPSFSFDIASVSTDSGALSGSADLGKGGGTAELVDNEYTIEDTTGSDIVDPVLGLPIEEPGLAWFDLHLEFDTGAEQPKTGTLAGEVLDQNGDPVEGATVTVPGADESIETDSAGAYALDGIPTGSYELVVDAENYVEERTTVEITAGETTEQQVELEPKPAELELSVEGGAVTAGESIEVTGAIENVGGQTAETTASLAVGGLGSVKESVEVAPGESVEITSEFETSADDIGEYTATLTVGDQTAEASVVVEDPSGGPEPVATFTATNTGEGYISFDEEDESTAIEEGLAFPEGEITIEGEVYEDGTWESTSVEFPVLEPAPGLEADATVPNGLSGEFDQNGDFISANGQLTVTILTEAEPSFSFDIGSVSTESGDLSGSADLGETGGTAELVDNEYTIEDTTGSDIVDPVLGLPIEEPGLAWFDLHLEFEMGAEPPETGGLAGEVLDQNGDPVEGATVTVPGADETVETDSAGEYEINGLGVGSYDLVVNAPGAEQTTREIEIVAGETTAEAIELTVAGSGTLTGTVVDESGEPIEDAAVAVPAAIRESITGVDGQFEIPDLPAGEYNVAVGASGYGDKEITVEIVAGETTEREVVLEGGEPELELEVIGDTVATDTELEVVGLVENVGGGIAEAEAQLSVEGLVSTGQSVEVEGGETEEVSVTVVPSEAGEYTATLTVGNQTVEDTIVVEGGEVVANFRARAVGDGYVSFNQETESDAAEEGTAFPDANEVTGDEVLWIEGEILSSGRWRAVDANLPLLESSGLDIQVENRSALVGEIDPESGYMSVETEFLTTVLAEEEPSFPFEVNADTGVSNGLTGEADFEENTLDLDEGEQYSASVTLVDNDFPVDVETGNSIIDPALGLPSEEPANNWFNLELEMEIREGELGSGAIEGTVTDDDGDPVSGATVQIGAAETLTDPDGSYQIGGISTGTQELVVSKESYIEESVDVEIESEATVEQDVELEPGEPDFELAVDTADITAGEELSVVATIGNLGTAPGETDVSLSVEGLSSTETSVEVPVQDSVTVTDTIPTDEDDAGERTMVLEAGGQTLEKTILIEEPKKKGGSDSNVRATFTAKSLGDGFISFDERDESTAIEEGVDFPADEIQIQGEIYDDGTWQSTGIQFPALETDDGLEAAVTIPEPLSGEIDPRSGVMTAEGKFGVTITDAKGNPSFTFSIDATTQSSGALSGDGTFQQESATVTLVDNEYTIPAETDDEIINSALGLPLTDSGLAWFELGLEMDIEQGEASETGTVSGVVESGAGEPLADATVGVEGEIQSTTTASDGSFTLENVPTGAQTLVVEANGYDEQSVKVTVDADKQSVAGDVELEAGDPEFEANLDSAAAEPGETVSVSGTVENVGDGPGTEEVTISVAGESVTETVSLAPGESSTIELEWEAGDTEAQYTAEIGVGDESEEATADVTIQSDGASSSEDGGSRFVATSQGGFVSFAADSLDAALEDVGVEFPSASNGDSTIEIVGVVEDGEWEAAAENIQFPVMKSEQGIEVVVTAPNGLEGEIDPESDALTVRGELQVRVGGEDADEVFSFTIDTTTGESGALSGEASFDTESGAGTATIVDNEFTVDDKTGSDVIDSSLGLPTTESGTNWFELQVDIEYDLSEEESQSKTDQSDDDSEEPEQSDDEDEGESMLTTLGFVGGMAGIVIAGGVTCLALLGRLLSRIDPDPES